MNAKAPGFRLRSALKVAFSPDGPRLATITKNSVAVWDVQARARLSESRVLRHASALAFVSDDALVLKNTLGQIALCRPGNEAPTAAFTPEGRDEGSNLVVFNNRIVDGSWGGEIRVRKADLRPEVVWAEPRTMVTRVTLGGATCALVVVAKHDHADHQRGADRLLFAGGHDLAGLTPLAPRWRVLRDACLPPSGTRVAVRSGTGLETVDVASGRLLASAQTSVGGTGYALAWSPDELHLVLVEKGGFSFRDASSLREVGWLASPYPAAIAFAPRGDLIALGDWEAGLVLAWPELLGQLKPRDLPR